MFNSGTSINTQRTYHGAAATLLIAQKKYADAIPHLEEDIANPQSMKLLIVAYRKTAANKQAGAMSKKLLEWKIPTIEEALAVSAFRSEEAISAKN